MIYARHDFEALVRRHQAMVYGIAVNFFGQPHLAEEVAQDVFLQLFENLASINSTAHLTSWLRRTTTHRCIDAVRRPSSKAEIPMDHLPELAEPVFERDPLRDERLRKLVASLPEKHRMIIILRYGQDLDPGEIAQIMDIPLATVRSYLWRALALLREKAPTLLGEVKNGSI